jgi:cytochrome c oxidase subunit 2
MKTRIISLTLILVIFLIGLSSVSLAAKKPAPKPVATPIIKVTTKKFEFAPNPIILKKGQLTVISLTSLDVRHGFNCPDLKLRADIMPGSVTVLKVKAMKTGAYPFFCDVYCGEGHQGMVGKIVVNE